MKKVISILLLSFAGLGLAATVHADSHEAEEAAPPSLSDVWVMVPKEGHREEFEEGLKEHLVARKEADDPRAWHTYDVAVGDDMSTYVVRHCCFEWADQDAYEEWSMGTELPAHFDENVAPHVASYEHYIDSIDWENSKWGSDVVDWSFVGVTEWRPKMGEARARNEALSKMIGTAKEHGWEGRWVFFSSIGGPSNLKIAIPYTDWADMAPPETTFYEFMAEHLGEEDANAMFKKFSSSFWGSEYTVYRLRTDLSTPTVTPSVMD